MLTMHSAQQQCCGYQQKRLRAACTREKGMAKSCKPICGAGLVRESSISLRGVDMPEGVQQDGKENAADPNAPPGPDAAGNTGMPDCHSVWCSAVFFLPEWPDCDNADKLSDPPCEEKLRSVDTYLLTGEELCPPSTRHMMSAAVCLLHDLVQCACSQLATGA